MGAIGNEPLQIPEGPLQNVYRPGVRTEKPFSEGGLRDVEAVRGRRRIKPHAHFPGKSAIDDVSKRLLRRGLFLPRSTLKQDCQFRVLQLVMKQTLRRICTGGNQSFVLGHELSST